METETGEPTPTGRPTMDPLTTSDQINHVAGALAAAQAEVEGASKDATNPHFKSRYADLASVWEACRAALTKNGLAVTQVPSGEGRAVRLTTLLVHKSGQWIGGTSTMNAGQDTPQAVGSCLTYLRRYSLSALVGVAPEDDDGNEASAGAGRPVQRATNGREQDDQDYQRARLQSEMDAEPRISGPATRESAGPKARASANVADDFVEVKDGRTGAVTRQPRVDADQLAEIESLAKRGGYDRASLLKLINDTFKVDDVFGLGRGQAIDLIRRLNKKVEAAENAMGAVAEFAREPGGDDGAPAR